MVLEVRVLSDPADDETDDTAKDANLRDGPYGGRCNILVVKSGSSARA